MGQTAATAWTRRTTERESWACRRGAGGPPSILSTVSKVGQGFTKATHQTVLEERLRDGIGVDEARRLAESLPNHQNVPREQALLYQRSEDMDSDNDDQAVLLIGEGAVVKHEAARDRVGDGVDDLEVHEQILAALVTELLDRCRPGVLHRPQQEGMKQLNGSLRADVQTEDACSGRSRKGGAVSRGAARVFSYHRRTHGLSKRLQTGAGPSSTARFAANVTSRATADSLAGVPFFLSSRPPLSLWASLASKSD